jgi:amidohydrolase
MIEEGALESPRPEAIFALHVVPEYQAGEIGYRAGGAMASSDKLEIRVRGKQTHAAYPWLGVDPIAVASSIVLALQALPGRQIDARLPSVVSIGAIHGGVRHNIIPGEVELLGTIRTSTPGSSPTSTSGSEERRPRSPRAPARAPRWRSRSATRSPPTTRS